MEDKTVHRLHIKKKYGGAQIQLVAFALLQKSRTLRLLSDIQIDLFDKTVKPMLLYGSEILGCGNCDVIERIHLKFFKIFVKPKKIYTNIHDLRGFGNTAFNC